MQTRGRARAPGAVETLGKLLDDEGARDALAAYGLLSWQIMQLLAIARVYGLSIVSIRGREDVPVRYTGRGYLIGDLDLTGDPGISQERGRA